MGPWSDNVHDRPCAVSSISPREGLSLGPTPNRQSSLRRLDFIVANELILLVEDNDKNRKLMRDVLTFKGYRLAEAETGEDGVRLARELHPDLVLMDIQLPGINGITAFRQIRDDPTTATIPVLAVTASVMPQDRKTIIAAGFDGYQSKPLSVTGFLEVVRQTLDR